MQFGNRDILKAPARPAKQMLMRAHVRVEPPNRARRAHLPNQALVLKKLKSAINRRLRQAGKLFAQPLVDGFHGGMRQILGQRSIDSQTLRRNSNAPRATLLLEVRAPAFNFTAETAQELFAANSHLRIIII